MEIKWQLPANAQAKAEIEETITAILAENEAIKSLVESGDVSVVVREKSSRKDGKFILVAIVKKERTLPSMEYTAGLPAWGFKAVPHGENLTFHIPDPRE